MVPLADYVPYQVVERALALMCTARFPRSVGPCALGWTASNARRRSRIDPGRGQRIVYDREARVWLLLALELEEFGIEPATVGALFERDRETLRKLATKAANAGSEDEDILLTVQPAFVSAGWRGKSDLPTIGKIDGRKAMDSFPEWLRGASRGGGVTGSSPRACVFNLSARLRALDAALVEAAKPQPPAPTGMAKQILDAGKAARGEMTLKEFRAKHGGKRSK